MGINDFIKIGNQIKKYRELTGIKQKEMAEKLHIPISTYSNYENNNREPSSELVEKIAKILKVSPFDLVINSDEIVKQEFFIRYLESLGYSVQVHQEVSSWHQEEEQDNDGNFIEKSQIADESQGFYTLNDRNNSITLTEEEFENFRIEITNAISFAIFHRKQR